jgi:fucose 4-O-acetylase-like acetyltransferase
MSMVVKHNKMIGIGKALCIILMVIGHSGCPLLFRNWLYTFHMPFFFFVSGYLFNTKALDSFFPFVKKKMKGLLLPFVKWNIIFILLHNFFYECHFLQEEYSLNEIIKRIIFSFCMKDYEYMLNPFWFLQQLIRVNIIVWLLLKTIKFLCNKMQNITYNSAIIFVTIIITILTVIAYYINFKIPGIMSKLTMISILFYLSGYNYKLFEQTIHQFIQPKLLLFIGIALTIIEANNFPVEMGTLTTYRILPYWFIGVLGCLMVLSISKRISIMHYSKYLDYIGDHTLAIMTWHFLIFKFLSLLLMQFGIISKENLLTWPVPDIAKNGWWTLYSFFGVCIPLLIDLSLKTAKENLKKLLPSD